MMMQRVCLFDPLVAAGGPQPSKVNSRKSLFHGFCLFFFVSLSAFGGVEAEMCGIPGRSQKGIVALQHSTSSYNSGQRAEYSCQHAFTQLGNATRICQHGGLWSGTWPRCAANVAFKKAVASSPIIDGYRANSLVDADTQSCIYLDMQVLDRYVQIDLGTNQLIAGLVIHIPEGYIQEVSIFVAEKLTTSSGIQYRRCTNSLSRIEPSKTHVECKSETGKIGVTGRFIHIRDEREIKDFYFALCEVEVYTKEVTATCGVPDSPAFGNHSILGHHTTEFSCQTGFYLDGARYLTCHQGNWIGHAPRCIPYECQALKPIDNGFIDVWKANEDLANYTFNSVAHHYCTEGYMLFGNALRTCGQNGLWTGIEPQCRRNYSLFPSQNTLYRSQHREDSHQFISNMTETYHALSTSFLKAWFVFHTSGH